MGEAEDSTETNQGITPSAEKTTPHRDRGPRPPSGIKPATADADPAYGGLTTASTPFPAPVPEHASSVTMMFSDLYKSPKSTLTRLRNSLPRAVPVASDSGYDADLLSRDKARQKDAIRKLLASKVRNDWDFSWPSPFLKSTSGVTRPAATSRPTSPERPAVHDMPTLEGNRQVVPEVQDNQGDRAPDSGDRDRAERQSDVESVYSTVTEDNEHWRARADSTSDFSGDSTPIPGPSPYRFDEAIEKVAHLSVEARKARRRRAIRDEMSWNAGLACFEARRTAWTGSKTVRVKSDVPPLVSPSSPRRLFWRHHRADSTSSQRPHSGGTTAMSPTPSSPISTAQTHPSHVTAAAALTPRTSDPDLVKPNSSGAATSRGVNETPVLYTIQTLLPIPSPFLPPQNPMRASVTPNIYSSLYDKIVVGGMQPSCPVNLSDMISSCVVGWKRDGEWPAQSTVAPVPTTAAQTSVTRQQKIAQKDQKRKATSSIGSSGRRRSFGFLAGKTDHKTKVKDGKTPHEDDDGSNSAGRLKRSLQKVFSRSHGHAQEHATSPTA